MSHKAEVLVLLGLYSFTCVVPPTLINQKTWREISLGIFPTTSDCLITAAAWGSSSFSGSSLSVSDGAFHVV